MKSLIVYNSLELEEIKQLYPDVNNLMPYIVQRSTLIRHYVRTIAQTALAIGVDDIKFLINNNFYEFKITHESTILFEIDYIKDVLKLPVTITLEYIKCTE